jgi:hypothetical protein
MPATTTSLHDERRRARTPAVARDFMTSTDGWHVIDHGKGGTVAHRGVIHPAEYVDVPALGREVRRLLGVTRADLDTVYCQGRKSAAQRELRERIDARLLDVAEAGGNMTLLAQVLNLDTQTIGRALTRARQRKETT